METMKQAKTAPASIYVEERVPVRSAKSFIESVAHPMSGIERRHLEDLIDQESRTLVSAYYDREMEALHQALATRDSLSVLRERAEADSAAAEEQKRQIEKEPAPVWAKALISTFCALACFGAEFVLTWHALTFVLNVERYSVLGVLLGLAPPCALAVLELVIARLFESPWRSLRSAANLPRWRKALAVAAMVLLLAGLAWGNIHTVLLLAAAREEAAKAQHNALLDEGEETIAVDRAVINRAILAVSVCVTLDGALFLLLALDEWRALRNRRQACRAVARLRAAKDALVQEHLKAAGSAVCLEQSRERWKENSSLLADRFRNQCLYELEQKLRRSRREMPTEALIEAGLRERLSA